MHLHSTLNLLALTATAVLAIPHPQVSLPITIPESTLTVVPTTSLNIPITPTPDLPVPTTSLLISTGTGGIISLPGNTTGWWSSGSSSSSSKKRPGHTEPIPIFSRSCDCPDLKTVQYPCWATDSLQRCNFEELHSFMCWTSAARGCPTPTRACSTLFQPTPVTGRHPCELLPNNPTTTEVVPTITATIVVPTITMPPNGTTVLKR